MLAALACFGATAIVALCLRRYVDVEWTKSPEARVATVLRVLMAICGALRRERRKF